MALTQVQGGMLAGSSNTVTTIQSNDTTAITVDASQNVGIGTTTPTNKVHIQQTSAGASLTQLVLQNADNTSGTGSAVGFANHTSSGLLTGKVESAIDGGNAYSMRFYTYQSGLNERLRIDADGNLKFNSGYGSVATAYGCRAWVNFNGTGTVAIRGSGNVSSITDNSTGTYTVNFSTAMTDANYSVTGIGAHVVGVVALFGVVREGSRTTSGVQIDYFTTGSTLYDTNDANVAIFR